MCPGHPFDEDRAVYDPKAAFVTDWPFEPRSWPTTRTRPIARTTRSRSRRSAWSPGPPRRARQLPAAQRVRAIVLHLIEETASHSGTLRSLASHGRTHRAGPALIALPTTSRFRLGNGRVWQPPLTPRGSPRANAPGNPREPVLETAVPGDVEAAVPAVWCRRGAGVGLSDEQQLAWGTELVYAGEVIREAVVDHRDVVEARPGSRRCSWSAPRGHGPAGVAILAEINHRQDLALNGNSNAGRSMTHSALWSRQVEVAQVACTEKLLPNVE